VRVVRVVGWLGGAGSAPTTPHTYTQPQPQTYAHLHSCTQTHRHTDTQTHRHTHPPTHPHRQRGRETDRKTDTHTAADAHTHTGLFLFFCTRNTRTHPYAQTHTHTHTHTHSHTHTHTHTHLHSRVRLFGASSCLLLRIDCDQGASLHDDELESVANHTGARNKTHKTTRKVPPCSVCWFASCLPTVHRVPLLLPFLLVVDQLHLCAAASSSALRQLCGFPVVDLPGKLDGKAGKGEERPGPQCRMNLPTLPILAYTHIDTVTERRRCKTQTHAQDPHYSIKCPQTSS
jgi:hypothetical protein